MKKFVKFLIIFLILFSSCQKKPKIKIYVLGVDWSYSLYCLDENKERERIFNLVKNILQAKSITPLGNFTRKTFNGVVRGLPLNTFIFIPIASDELSYREKIYKGTSEELLWFIKDDESKILPPLKTYTHKTDFIDFFNNLAKNEVEKQIEILSKHISFKRDLVDVSVEYILITDGIHDPRGIINVPGDIEQTTFELIRRYYPNFNVDDFSKQINLPEKTERIIFIGVPPRIKFDLWNEVLKRKNVECLFLEYNELKDLNDVRKKMM